MNVPSRNEAVLKQADLQAMHIGMPVTIARAAMGAILNSSVAFEECIVSNIYERPCQIENRTESYLCISLIAMTRMSDCSVFGNEQKPYGPHRMSLALTPYNLRSSWLAGTCVWGQVLNKKLSVL